MSGFCPLVELQATADLFFYAWCLVLPRLVSVHYIFNSSVVSPEARCQADQRISPQERYRRRSLQDRWRLIGRSMLTGPVYSGGPGVPGGPSHPCGHCRGHGGQGQVGGVLDGTVTVMDSQMSWLDRIWPACNNHQFEKYYLHLWGISNWTAKNLKIQPVHNWTRRGRPRW